MRIDFRERYKPLFRVGSSDYAVIEEHSKRIVAPGSLSYDEALDISDRENALKAERVRHEISG